MPVAVDGLLIPKIAVPLSMAKEVPVSSGVLRGERLGAHAELGAHQENNSGHASQHRWPHVMVGTGPQVPLL